jgi:hypothetical protein
MQTKYTYKDKTYTNIYPLSETLGKDGVFIPLSIGDEALAELNVTVMREEEPLEVIKQRKIAELKYQRDTAEVQPIEYNGNLYDYDEKARDRINVAIAALGDTGSLSWTTADNKEVTVTGVDLRSVLIEVAKRSIALHKAYRAAREKVLNATTKEEVEQVVLNG